MIGRVWWKLALGVVAGLLLLWLALLVVLWWAVPGESVQREAGPEGRDRGNRDRGSRSGEPAPEESGLREALRLLPDIVRLLRRLAADRTLPRGVRIRLALLLGYLALPVDLVPDFIPVLGYVDDAVVVALALRSVVRHAGSDALAQHWPGTPTGLRSVHRLAGLPEP
jgi:uncharacterized membrane protein YkvA (DUF1232 family)